MRNNDVSMIALQGLVKALNQTNWSSWQTTAGFDEHLRGAEAVIAAERIRDAAPDLLEALQALVDAMSAEVCDETGLWSEYADAIAALAKARGES